MKATMSRAANLLWMSLVLASDAVASFSPGQCSLDGREWPSTNEGCEALRILHADKVFLPGSEVYEWENQQFWSNTQLLSPACVYRPTTALDVSDAIKICQKTKTEFALRGGAHMGIKGANNINDGMLMVASSLTALDLSHDKQTVTLGPGHHWGQVYKYLEQYEVAVAGGRLAPVGVPGLLLAGGINFYGNQHGWSADTVIENEVVLADGEVITASAEENSDLFWALKGGSSNFGIVTSFKLRTLPSKRVWAGTYTVPGNQLDKFFAAIANFTASNADPLSHIVPMVLPLGPGFKVGSAVLFYDSPDISEPDCFKQFLSIPSIQNTLGFKTVAEFAEEMGALVVDKINDLFIAGTTVGKDYETLLTGVKLTNNVFFDAVDRLHELVPAENFVATAINWQPLTDLWQAGSERSNPGGSPLTLDIETKGAHLAWALVIEWKSSQYDDIVMSWAEATTAAIEKATQEAGIYDAFNYMGDAAGFQEIYDGFGEEIKQKLLSISRKYDPDRAFQKLMPGGFKLGL